MSNALLNRAIEIIETGDQRLLASDGPAGGQPPDISLAEWRELYVCLTKLRASPSARRLDCELSRFGVSIREGPLPRGKYGEWDETTGIVTIAEDQHPIGKHVVLIHELLHVTESLLLQDGVIRRRVGEAFVTNAAPILLGLLICAGRYNGAAETGLAELFNSLTEGT